MKVYNQNKLHKRLRREMGNAIADFNMIEEGDRVMVCMSGGKDSYTMLDILMNLKISAPVNFELVAVHLALNHPQYPAHVLPDYLSNLGVEYHIITENIYQIVTEKSEKSKSPCSLCSRLRRGILYRVAREIGATKIALGHHRDDILETLFLNMFYGGKMKAMPPKLLNDTGEHVLIRPLAYCKEKDIINYAQVKAFPIIPCGYCGFEPNVQRQVIKQMFQEWDKKFPGRIETMFRATQNVTLSHLCDNNLFNFKGIKKDDAIVDSRCITFDRELDLPTNDK